MTQNVCRSKAYRYLWKSEGRHSDVMAAFMRNERNLFEEISPVRFGELLATGQPNLGDISHIVVCGTMNRTYFFEEAQWTHDSSTKIRDVVHCMHVDVRREKFICGGAHTDDGWLPISALWLDQNGEPDPKKGYLKKICRIVQVSEQAYSQLLHVRQLESKQEMLAAERYTELIRMHECGNCTKACSTTCDRCKAQAYCSEACQKKDWEDHAALCVTAEDRLEMTRQPDNESRLQLVRQQVLNLQGFTSVWMEADRYNELMRMNRCGNCEKPCNRQCERCGSQAYCSETCEKNHWGQHLITCVTASERLEIAREPDVLDLARQQLVRLWSAEMPPLEAPRLVAAQAEVPRLEAAQSEAPMVRPAVLKAVRDSLTRLKTVSTLTEEDKMNNAYMNGYTDSESSDDDSEWVPEHSTEITETEMELEGDCTETDTDTESISILDVDEEVIQRVKTAVKLAEKAKRQEERKAETKANRAPKRAKRVEKREAEKREAATLAEERIRESILWHEELEKNERKKKQKKLRRVKKRKREEARRTQGEATIRAAEKAKQREESRRAEEAKQEEAKRAEEEVKQREEDRRAEGNKQREEAKKREDESRIRAEALPSKAFFQVSLWVPSPLEALEAWRAEEEAKKREEARQEEAKKRQEARQEEEEAKKRKEVLRAEEEAKQREEARRAEESARQEEESAKKWEEESRIRAEEAWRAEEEAKQREKVWRAEEEARIQEAGRVEKEARKRASQLKKAKKKVEEKKRAKGAEEKKREAEEIHQETLRAISLQKSASDKIQLALKMEKEGLLQLAEARNLMNKVKERARLFDLEPVQKKQKTFWSHLKHL